MSVLTIGLVKGMSDAISLANIKAPGYPIFKLPSGVSTSTEAIENYVLSNGLYHAVIWDGSLALARVDIAEPQVSLADIESGVVETPTLAVIAQETGQVIQSIQGSETGAQEASLAVACTADAKVCPDGSYVSRIPPNCDFAPCPTYTPTTSEVEEVLDSIQSVSENQQALENQQEVLQTMDETTDSIQATEQDGTGFDFTQFVDGMNLPEWVTGSTWITGVPNWALLAAGGIGLFILSGRR